MPDNVQMKFFRGVQKVSVNLDGIICVVSIMI